MKNERIAFCPNQITLETALGLAQRDRENVNLTVVYWPDRCDVRKLIEVGVKCVPYGAVFLIYYSLLKLWRRNVEVLLPHRKLGRLINIFTYTCTTTSIIDDGLDTFRNQPRNVDTSKFRNGTKFYTFEYKNTLGEWVEKLEIQKVTTLEAIEISSRKKLDLASCSTLVIESPPLERIKNWADICGEDDALIRHSSSIKRKITDFPGAFFNGSDIALETSLKDFSGKVIVGESMVAVYALMKESPRYNLEIYIAKENVENLKPLTTLASTRRYARVHSI